MSMVVKGTRLAAGTFARNVAYCDAPNWGFDANSRFINLFNNTNQNWHTSSLGNFPINIANGYILNMVNGDSIACNIWNFSTNSWHRIKAGHYILKWSGAQFTATVTGTGVSGGAMNGTNRYEFDLAQFTTGAVILTVSFANATGSTGSITAGAAGVRGSLVLCHTDHEIAWDGGAIWNPDYVSFLGSNVSYFRSAKGSAVENNYVTTDTTAVLNEGHLFWGANADATDTGWSTTGIPYSAVAKLCVLLGCDYLANFPMGGTDAVYAVIAAQIASVSAFTGNIFPEVGNENWGAYKAPTYPTSGAAMTTWLNTTYAAAHGLTQAPESEAHIAMRAAAALKAAGISASRVKLSLAFQTKAFLGNTTPGCGSYPDIALNLVDTGNLMGQGATKKVYELCEQVFVSGYATPNDGSHIGLSDSDSYDMYYGRIQAVDWKTRTDAQMDAFYDAGIEETVRWIAATNTYLTNLRPALATTLASYEMGHQFVGGSGNLATLLYTLNITTNTGVWDSGILGNPSNGDIVRFYTNAPFTTWTEKDYFIRVVDANNFRVYATGVGVGSATDTYANDAAAKAASITLNSASGGPFYLANWTRCVESFDRTNTYFASAAGLAFYQRTFSNFVGVGKCRAYCQSVDLEGWTRSADWPAVGTSGPTYEYLHGLKGSLYDTDTPRSLWFPGLH